MTAEALHTWGSDADAVAPPNGGNHNPLWQDRERRLSIGSFTALVGVCLSD